MVVYLLAGSIAGIIITVLLLKLYSGYLARKQSKKVKEALLQLNKDLEELNKALQSKIKQPPSKAESLMRQVEKIQDEQLALLSTMDTPNANSLHAKYKNATGATIKQLEADKMEILKTLLRDHPEVKVGYMKDGKIETSTIKDYLSSEGITVEEEKPKLSVISQEDNVIQMFQSSTKPKHEPIQ